MANIRTLKKEINGLVYEVLSDCSVASFLNAEKDAEIEALFNKTMDLYNATMTKVYTKGDKKHYSAIKKELVDGVDAILSELQALINKK
ncbi:MAG: hypothetical protein MJ069_05855 [Salinivirgaceae bacterium]|nr:hypothetical protein [Salinivirgaceae bacterium]